MSTLFSWVDAKGCNPLWPGIQYGGTRFISLAAFHMPWLPFTCMQLCHPLFFTCVAGPDPLRPSQIAHSKAASEKMLLAASLDLGTISQDPAALEAALKVLGVTVQQVGSADGTFRNAKDLERRFLVISWRFAGSQWAAQPL